MKRRILLATALLTATYLTGCDRVSAAVDAFQSPPTKASPASVEVVPWPTNTQPLTPTGKGLPVKALPDVALQTAVNVVELTPLTQQGDMGGKLFGTASGDPAMNGLNTYIAFYRSPAEGWWVYQIGDFLSYSVLREAPGLVDLEVEESVIDQATGQIGASKRRIMLAFEVGPVGDQPVSLGIVPAA